MTASAVGTAKSHNEMAFAAWSSVYDVQANPLLSLEERYLKQILPSLDDKDVLDLGCGTGRWLANINRIGSPKTLQGIDGSSEMLSIARKKKLSNASLINTKLPSIPLQSESIDLCLVSFVLSYISNIDSNAREISRVLRHGADLFIADMHPVTAVELGWQRSFSCEETAISLKNETHSIESIICSLAQFGLRLVASYEPSFGQPECSVFQYRGKKDLYYKASDKPAIYILHFKRDEAALSKASTFIENARLVLGAEEELIAADLSVENTIVTAIHARPLHHHDTNRIDLSGYTIFPGLINAHDHLEFALYPKLGIPPYQNATQWALDVQNRYRQIITRHRQIPKWVRLWWGALRNLLCGVTTVCHHNPFHSVFNDPIFPIKVIPDFGWAHSLAFAENLASAHLQTHPSHPFILHACEGVDSEASREFADLEALNLIEERTVLVHGLSLASSEIMTCNRRGTSIISCPSSNKFLFSKTHSLEQINSIDRLAIGSDSPLSAVGDLLDEVRFCSEEIGMAPKKLFHCVTRSPAQILRLKSARGVIAPGHAMDIFAVRNSALSPAQHLTTLSWRDIELVIVDGVVRLASTEMLQRLPSHTSKQLSCLLIEDEPRWFDAPVDKLFQSAAEVLGAENLSLGGRTLSFPEL